MASFDHEQFTFISSTTPSRPASSVFGDYEAHSNGVRKATAVALSNSLRARHPDLTLAITDLRCDLLGFAGAGFAHAILDSRDGNIIIRSYVPPAKQLNGEQGSLVGGIVFAKYEYRWKEHDFLVYIAEGYKDGGYGTFLYMGILCEPIGEETATSKSALADELIFAASSWSLELHNEVWVFDRLMWQKNRGLWEQVQKAFWEDVILDEEMKQKLRNDIEGFYDDRETYQKFKIPWKRGIILYGPPGNGKTISIKAMMRTLSTRPKAVPTLYVKSFGFDPEYGIRSIFQKARSTAPCLLLFEDLDSLISPQVRSYFLNEVDGLEDNDGILMLGSTNHLELLDPGISKRPSRFDRKYLFPLPSLSERTEYCQYWRAKLASNLEIEFPKRLCGAIAEITEDFSFAYMKEAFVASLLALVVNGKARKSGWVEVYREGDGLEGLPLWKEIQKQVKTLRDELEAEKDRSVSRELMS